MARYLTSSAVRNGYHAYGSQLNVAYPAAVLSDKKKSGTACGHVAQDLQRKHLSHLTHRRYTRATVSTLARAVGHVQASVRARLRRVCQEPRPAVPSCPSHPPQLQRSGPASGQGILGRPSAALREVQA